MVVGKKNARRRKLGEGQDQVEKDAENGTIDKRRERRTVPRRINDCVTK